MKYFALLMMLFYFPLSFAGVGMVTGSETGTYIKFGQQIREVSKKKGVDIEVKTSAGSIDNIQRMMSKENAAFGIVQSDVMSYLLRSNNPELKKASQRLRMIYPFYNEEVHVLTSENIKSIHDLQGKKVFAGPTKSGTNMTATNVFQLLGIQPNYISLEHLPKGKKKYIRALALLLNGDIDAIFYVSGKPSTLFSEKLKLVMNAGHNTQNVHFIPLDDNDLLNGTPYVSSTLNHKDYNFFVKDTVPTIAVKAMLVTFDFSQINNLWDKGRIAYYKQRCSQVNKIAQAIKENIYELKSIGHDKWKEVDLNQNIGSWKRSRCTDNPSSQYSKTSTYIPPSNPTGCNAIYNSVERLECLMK